MTGFSRPDLDQPIQSVRFAAIDFESAGADPGKGDVPIQVGIACMGPGEVPVGDLFVSYLATDRPVKWSASRVHGITTSDLANAPRFLDLWPEVAGRMRGSVAVAHGAGTERRFLAAFPGHQFAPWIDTLQLGRRILPQAGSHALGDLCRALELDAEVGGRVPGRDWHDALFDAVASLVLLAHLIRMLDLAEAPLRCLVEC